MHLRLLASAAAAVLLAAGILTAPAAAAAGPPAAYANEHFQVHKIDRTVVYQNPKDPEEYDFANVRMTYTCTSPDPTRILGHISASLGDFARNVAVHSPPALECNGERQRMDIYMSSFTTYPWTPPAKTIKTDLRATLKFCDAGYCWAPDLPPSLVVEVPVRVVFKGY